jgi:hypothetical protein
MENAASNRDDARDQQRLSKVVSKGDAIGRVRFFRKLFRIAA